MLSISDIIVILSSSALLIGTVAYIFYQQHKAQKEESQKVQGSKELQLQAYERLLLLIDRIALHNVISRTTEPGLHARELQLILARTIKEEYDYNITQQLYVSPKAWEAIKNLKDQNILIVNRLSNSLPANAQGMDLNRLLLEFLMNDPKGTLHEVAAAILSAEARRLL